MSDEKSRNLVIAIVVIAIGLLAVIGGATYIILSRIEADKIDRKNQESSQKIEKEIKDASEARERADEKVDLAECIADAHKAYEESWNNESAALGMNGTLPVNLAELHDKRLESAKEDCYEMY